MKRLALAVAAVVLLIAGAAWAQFGRGYNASLSARMARADSFDGRFHYCRGQYRMNPGGDGGSWLTDYPLADIDLSIRLARSEEHTSELQSLRHLVCRLLLEKQKK